MPLQIEKVIGIIYKAAGRLGKKIYRDRLS